MQKVAMLVQDLTTRVKNGYYTEGSYPFKKETL
jgi:hypothetical protein